MTIRPLTTTEIKSTKQQETNKETKDKALENIASKKDWDNHLKFSLTGLKFELREVNGKIDSIEVYESTTVKEQQEKKVLYNKYNELKKEIICLRKDIIKNKEVIDKIGKRWNISIENVDPKGPFSTEISKNED